MIAKYRTLYNPTVDCLKQAALQHPKAFIFSFCTNSVDEVLDYSSIFSEEAIYEEWMERVLTPLYIGNFKPEDQNTLVSQIIKIYLPEEAEHILMHNNGTLKEVVEEFLSYNHNKLRIGDLIEHLKSIEEAWGNLPIVGVCGESGDLMNIKLITPDDHCHAKPNCIVIEKIYT